MEKCPLITIGITCFNAEDTIERAVKSALDQDWGNIEVIVVDDCSRDSSLNILSAIQKNNKKVRIIAHEQNRGFPGSLNTIIESARGEFVAFFDDDDVSAPHRLSRQWQKIISYEQASGANTILCYSDRNIQLPWDENPKHAAYAIGRHAPEPYGSAVADFILLYRAPAPYCWGMFGSCTLMARKSVFEKVGKFDEHFRRSAEWDYAIRASFLRAHFIAVDQPLILQVKTAGADKSDKISQKYKIELRKKYKEYLKKKRCYMAALLLAHAGKRSNRLRYFFVRLLAMLLAPHIFWGRMNFE